MVGPRVTEVSLFVSKVSPCVTEVSQIMTEVSPRVTEEKMYHLWCERIFFEKKIVSPFFDSNRYFKG